MECPKCGKQFGWHGMVSVREHVREHRELAFLQLFAQYVREEEREEFVETLKDLNEQSNEMMVGLIICASSFKLHEFITN